MQAFEWRGRTSRRITPGHSFSLLRHRLLRIMSVEIYYEFLQIAILFTVFLFPKRHRNSYLPKRDEWLFRWPLGWSQTIAIPSSWSDRMAVARRNCWAAVSKRTVRVKSPLSTVQRRAGMNLLCCWSNEVKDRLSKKCREKSRYAYQLIFPLSNADSLSLTFCSFFT